MPAWRKAGLILTGLLLFINGALAQSPDSLPVLPLGNFLREVSAFHPAARNAQLLNQQALAGLRASRGAFDPKLYASWEQKSFDGKNYYTIGENGLKWQTPFGLSLKSEFNVTRGQFLNPEDRLPAEGQAVIGLNLPLLNGLTFDPFRAEMRQAQNGLLAGQAQQQGQLNDLLFQAGLAYIDWAVSFFQVQVYRQAVGIADIRLKGMVESYAVGDKPAIDTLETFIQLQNRLFDLNESSLDLNNANLRLEVFRWGEGQPQQALAVPRRRPDALPEPVNATMPLLNPYVDGLAARHPDLRQLQIDLKQLDIDRRLAVEQFKPRLDLSYNFLANGTDFRNPVYDNGQNGLLRDLLTENYKWGLTFGFPLLLRKERGKLEQVRVKQLSTNNKLEQKQAEVENKIRAYYNDLETTRRQLELYAAITANYQALLVAEQRKFDIGESSVFLLNTREQKLIEAQIKLIKLQGQYQKGLLALSWAAGTLPTEYGQ